MQIKYFIPLFVLFFLSSNIVSACPPSTSEFLFVKETVESSELMKFIDTNMDIFNESRYSHKLHFLPWMSIDEKYDNSAFELILVDNSENIKVFEDTLFSLKRTGYHYGRKINYHYYEFPTQNFYESLTKINENISYFDNKIILVKLDNLTLREYVIGYEPAHIYDCGNMYRSSNYIMYTLIGVIAMIILSVIIVIVIKKRKK